MDQKPDIISEAIKQIQAAGETAKSMAANSEEVKSGKFTVEEMLQTPSYQLYQKITESTAAYFSIPGVDAACHQMAEVIGEAATVNIMNMVAVGMTHASHQAILFYDDLLKEEISAHFQNIIEHVNKNTADIGLCTGAMEVFKKQLGAITNRLKVEDITKGTNLHATAEE